MLLYGLQVVFKEGVSFNHAEDLGLETAIVVFATVMLSAAFL